MKLEHLLLGVLLQRPSTGYDIKKYLDTSGRFLRSNTQMSQVYRSLSRMESDGWVRHTVQERPTAAVDTKTYNVTAEGATIFLDWLKGPYEPPSRVQDPEFLARLSFAGFFTPEELIALLETEITVREQQIIRYRHRDRRLARDPVVPFDSALADLVGDYTHQWGRRGDGPDTSPTAAGCASDSWTVRRRPARRHRRGRLGLSAGNKRLLPRPGFNAADADLFPQHSSHPKGACGNAPQ